MRLLSYNINEAFIQVLKQHELYICDTAEDLGDALYHAQVRYYNAILIHENDLNVCKKFLKIIDPKYCAFLVLTSNTDKKFEMGVLKNGGIAVVHEPFCSELILAKLQSVHRENFMKRYHFKDYFILDRENKQVIDLDENRLNIKGKSFDILSYLLKDKQFRVISKDEIIGVLWDEPEMVSNNIVEVNINLIRNEIRKKFNVDFVSTIRNRGYKIEI
jgi:DNA-binding response OmpR family regulator